MNRVPGLWCQLGWLVLPLFAACASVPAEGGPLFAPDSPYTIVAASVPTRQPAAPVQSTGRGPKNQFDVMIGGSYWDGIGDLDTSTSGPPFGSIGDFDSLGWAFDLGYDRVVWTNRAVDWSLGLETGWSTFESNSSGYYTPNSDITGNMWYLAPASRWHFELTPQTALVAGIGAGYYGFSIEELSTYYYGYWWGYDSRTLSQDDEFGAFASLAFDFAMSPGSAFRIENKLHFVDFDGLDSLLTNESSVNGPIWTFEVGYVFKF